MANKKINTYVPDYLVKPGEVLEEYLESYRMTQVELSERTGLTKKTINGIIKGKAPITPKTALKFEKTLGRPAHFWINIESDYQQDLERIEEKKRLQNSTDWLKKFPVRMMIKFKWINEKIDKLSQIEELCRFFGIASPEQWESIQYNYAVKFRKTNKTFYSPDALSTWLRKGELEAQKIQCKTFDKKKFKTKLKDIRNLTTKNDSNFMQELINKCAMSGVAVVIVPQLPKTGAYGATRWIGDKPMIQLSLRYKTNDQFWFNFFHEAAHIIKHGRKEIFIEADNIKDEKEEEANNFAKDFLIPISDLNEYITQEKRINQKNLICFSNKVKIAPGIVVGRLQHDKIIPFDRYNNLKIRYEWSNFVNE